MSTQQGRFWLKSYPGGVPHDIDWNQYGSLVDLIEEAFTRYRDRSAYVGFGTTLSFADLDRLSRQLAAFLQGKGLVKGDRVAIMMPNVLQYPVAIAGVLRAGLVVVNVNPLYTPRELEHHARVLADREQHHRVARDRGDLAEDVDRLGFELGEVGQDRHVAGCRTRGPPTASLPSAPDAWRARGRRAVGRA
jgi:acyl-CoA synthetase (AMP-forming)/AMP-acid ligase II